jgi:hypothetical protein
MLTTEELLQLRQVASVLLPGDEKSPPAGSLPELDDLIAAAVSAVGSEAEQMRDGLAALPGQPGWEDLRAFSATHPDEFEVISTVVAGAYFMSTRVLDSLGYPHGQRKPVRNDLVVDELETGVLDPVLARTGMVRVSP